MLDNAYERKSASNNGDAPAAEDRRLPLKGTYVPPDMEAVDVFRLLDQLEELPEKAKHLPFNTLVGFDQEKFYYLVLKVRANLPEDMKKAYRVAKDTERIVDAARGAAEQELENSRLEAARTREAAEADAARILENARSEAQRIIEQARSQAAAMVDHSEVTRMAQAQAKDILARAETEANEIRKGADDYARDVLANIEGVLTRTIATVQRGREILEKARQ